MKPSEQLALAIVMGFVMFLVMNLVLMSTETKMDRNTDRIIAAIRENK